MEEEENTIIMRCELEREERIEREEKGKVNGCVKAKHKRKKNNIFYHYLSVTYTKKERTKTLKYENSQNYEKCITCITKRAIRGVTRSK